MRTPPPTQKSRAHHLEPFIESCHERTSALTSRNRPFDRMSMYALRRVILLKVTQAVTEGHPNIPPISQMRKPDAGMSETTEKGKMGEGKAAIQTAAPEGLGASGLPVPGPRCRGSGTCAPCGARTQGGACGGARVRRRRAEGRSRAAESPPGPVLVHAAHRAARPPRVRRRRRHGSAGGDHLPRRR